MNLHSSRSEKCHISNLAWFLELWGASSFFKNIFKALVGAFFPCCSALILGWTGLDWWDTCGPPLDLCSLYRINLQVINWSLLRTEQGEFSVLGVPEFQGLQQHLVLAAVPLPFPFHEMFLFHWECPGEGTNDVLDSSFSIFHIFV